MSHYKGWHESTEAVQALHLSAAWIRLGGRGSALNISNVPTLSAGNCSSARMLHPISGTNGKGKFVSTRELATGAGAPA